MTPPILNSSDNSLGFGEIVVQVRDAQGRAVDGVVVEFAAEPAWVQSVLIRRPDLALAMPGLRRWRYN